MNRNDHSKPAEEMPLGPQIQIGNKKTKRYGKRVVIVFIIFMLALTSSIGLQAKFNIIGGSAESPERSYRTPQQAGFTELATSMRIDRRQSQPLQTIPPQKTEKEDEKPQKTAVEIVRPAQSAGQIPTSSPSKPNLPKYYSNKDDAQAANTLRTLRLQALTAKPVVEDFANTGTGTATASNPPASGVMGEVPEGSMGMVAPAALGALIQQAAGVQGAQEQNGQGQKQDFLRSLQGFGGGSMTPQGYSQSIPIPRQFPYEMKAGTIIPGLLLTGINSDLPGNVLAQVSENVWDVTGRHVLIPKGTRVIGVYDSQITYGQRRVLLVWNRLVFPGGMALDIAGSPGVDMAGYSGLSGKVNEHWGRMFKAALFSSAFVAGAEIIYGDDSRENSEKKSPRDVAAESLASSVLDMGTKIMNKASDIQPTITVKPGKKMGIFVQQDVVFPFPYM